MNKINKDWKEVKLGDIGNIITGSTPPTKNKEYFGKDCLFITPTDYRNCNKYISNSERGISILGIEKLKNRLLPSGSIMVTCIATMGKVLINKLPAITNQQINSIIIDNKKFSADFIYYLLIHNNNKIKSIVSGSAVPILNKKDFSNLVFEFPPLAEQKRIASILSALDDKIELDNKTNKILEEMAQTIFKEWFINFNFPNEDGKPYKKSGGEMIDSELGKIPKGWKVGTIGDLISNLFNGDWGKDKNKEKYTKEVICIRGADIGDIFKGFDGNPVRRFILEKNLKSKKLLEGDIVMECSGGSPTQSTGRCIFVTKSLLSAYDKPLICTNFCKVIKIKEKEYRGYAYNLLWYLYNTRLFFLFENGTTGIKNLNVNNLFKRHMIAIPDIDVALEYNEIFLSLIDIMHANKKENEKLSNIRDSLLPKLMTPKGRRADGEIRV